MRNKKIVFHSEKPRFDILKPEPSSKFVPEWYRKMLGVKEGIATVKKCVPIIDSLTAGYMIPLPADVVWNAETQRFVSQAKFEMNSDHHPSQTDNIPVPEEYDSQPHKWINNWYVKTPPGYSTLFVHPLNRIDLPFYSFSGVVDTDKHPLVVNFPFVLKKDFSGTIKAGTPIIQAIPFKRNDWSSEVIDQGKGYDYPLNGENELPPFAWYKRKFWKRKLYR